MRAFVAGTGWSAFGLIDRKADTKVARLIAITNFIAKVRRQGSVRRRRAADMRGGRTLKMISSFPKDDELLAFFETEPTVSDADVPWIYNELGFTTIRSGIAVHCRFRPSYGELSTRLIVNGDEMVSLDLHEIESVHLNLSREDETLIATFRPSLRRNDCWLRLKPQIRIAWGTSI